MTAPNKGRLKGLVNNLRRRFLRLTIAKKLLMGFVPLIGLSLLISIFTMVNLQRLNRINDNVINIDIPLQIACDKINESLVLQELYGNRYIILQSTGSLDLFNGIVTTIQNEVNIIQQLIPAANSILEEIRRLHQEYTDLFQSWFQQTKEPRGSRTNYDSLLTAKEKELRGALQTITSQANKDQKEKTLQTSAIGRSAFQITAALFFLSLLIGLGAAIIITRNIFTSVKQLALATQEISKGNFSHTPNIHNQDELGDLAKSFVDMGIRLKQLEEHRLDSNPLTHLPGGNSIENTLKSRMNENKKFSFCQIDLDNFKAYNDRYGYSRGNSIIKQTAHLICRAVEQTGSGDDFVGHIGGDDFVVLTTPERHKQICQYIVAHFDTMVVEFYDKKDIKKGYIVGKTRTGEEIRFPIMSITIAVVTNENLKFSHYVQVGERAAELKEYAKSKEGSLFMVDRRKQRR